MICSRNLKVLIGKHDFKAIVRLDFKQALSLIYMTYNLSIIEKALRLAAVAHQKQTRKEIDLPYIIHPVMVAMKLEKHGFSEIVIAAALVHDVLEDTDVSKETLVGALGAEVVSLIEPTTHDNTLSWDEKKIKYIELVRGASEEVKAISVADKIHNAECLLFAHAAEGRDVWKYFKAGRDKKIWFEEAMLTMLRETWKHPLVDEYGLLVEKLRELSH